MITLLLFPISIFSQSQHRVSDSLKIGFKYGGGVIFYIDASGKHGLIAAQRDLPNIAGWGFLEITGAKYMNEGDVNSSIIVDYVNTVKAEIRKLHPDWDAFQKSPCAAVECDEWSWDGYSDWYLPSINELKQASDEQQSIGGFVMGTYCSSTEYNKYRFWCMKIKPGGKSAMKTTGKAKVIYPVRCIRRF